MSGFQSLLELGKTTTISSPGVEFVVMRKFTLFRHLVVYRVSRVDLLALFREGLHDVCRHLACRDTSIVHVVDLFERSALCWDKSFEVE